MRFKATILNEKINLFFKIISTLTKSSKECVIHLSMTKIQWIIGSMSQANDDGVQIWSGIPIDNLFHSFSLESINNNEIALQVNMDHLVRALKSGQNESEITLKLAKKLGIPYLSVIIGPGTGAMVLQDVPIIVLSAEQLAGYIEPALPDPEVHILMPSLKGVRHIIDKMKNHSDYLDIRATMTGDLTFSVSTENVTIKTFYKNLEHPIIEGREDTTQNEDKSASVKVSIKLFSKFLFSYQVLPTNVILCLVEDRAIVVHVLLEDLYLTYYIPVTSP